MKEKLVVIHQPDFMPYLGFFDRLIKADIYIVLDNVQYVRRNQEQWTNRDKIKTRNGAKWITVNVKKAHFDTNIRDIFISDDHAWRNKCKNVLNINYKKSLYYDEINPYIDEIFDFKCDRLMDFNLNAIYKINELLNINVKIILASELNAEGHGNELVIDIMKKLNQTKYLSGIGAMDYYDKKIYEKNNIEVIWQQFEHPVYPQQFDDFIPNLSVIDMLYNCGIHYSRQILREGAKNIHGK